MIEQGSVEWHLQRIGKVTASRVADVTAKTKTGYGASRANYLAELVAQRLTGVPSASFTNAAMQWGIDTEPQGRAAYEFFKDVTVDLAEFVDHPAIGYSGASPDGYVGEDGVVEIKCPLTATHIETLLGASIPEKYRAQMYWQMACTGRKWCDFVSFDPRMPGAMQMFVKRLDRDDNEIGRLENEVRHFLAEIDNKVTALQALYGEAKAA
ncbi:MAG TPA: YqaJ viral recombinase family protein [Bryobacteraceae bacterium]|nr:YqaJ viral recombinase family protein [Bryobacteraceae bacterium]